MTTKILLVGVGKMGSALLNGWSGLDNLVISTLDPHFEDMDYQSADEIQADFDVIILAVKPQVMADVGTAIRHLVTPSTLVLSIAAGKTIDFFETIFGKSQPIIRVMPNTPAIIHKGISVLYANQATTAEQRQIASHLLSAVGHIEWIDKESDMDAVTALSGSGPAYVYYMIEAMAHAGCQIGLSKTLAEKLARQTVIGSAALTEQEINLSLETLRHNVTSPGGTTEAGLQELMHDNTGLKPLMTRTLNAAQKRGQELAK
jgi:pyrroline-5-carboxylate reductase